MHWLSDFRKRLSTDPELERAWRKTSIWALLLSVLFCFPLVMWVLFALQQEIQSYLILVPCIAAYLVWIRLDRIPLESGGKASLSLGLGAAGLLLTGAYLISLFAGWPFAQADALTPAVAGFILLLGAGVCAQFGAATRSALLFPFCFLFFSVPLPERALTLLEIFLQHASAEATQVLFNLVGLSHLREGLMFRLPGITIQVAQECSGVRSTLVLLITSVVASQLFLRSPLKRAGLILGTFVLGILRNGFRILVIAWLCVERGPHMIDSWVHRQGGPIFFALSLLPLGVMLWLMIRAETGRRRGAILAPPSQAQ